MSYPTFQSRQTQTQVLTVGKTPGNGEILDLGIDSLGLISLITATISNVNLDGGTPGAFYLAINVVGSFDGVNWDSPQTVASGRYWNPLPLTSEIAIFYADDPTPLYGQLLMSRYLRFTWDWQTPVDLGASASATVNLKIEYF